MFVFCLWDGVALFVRFFNPSLQPAFYLCPGGFIRLELVVCSHVPDPKLSIAAIEMCAAVNGKARIRHKRRHGACDQPDEHSQQPHMFSIGRMRNATSVY